MVYQNFSSHEKNCNHFTVCVRPSVRYVYDCVSLKLMEHLKNFSVVTKEKKILISDFVVKLEIQLVK